MVVREVLYAIIPVTCLLLGLHIGFRLAQGQEPLPKVMLTKQEAQEIYEEEANWAQRKQKPTYDEEEERLYT